MKKLIGLLSLAIVVFAGCDTSNGPDSGIDTGTDNTDKIYTVTFNLGDVPAAGIGYMRVNANDKITKPQDPDIAPQDPDPPIGSNPGKPEFAGWYKDNPPTIPWNFDADVVTGDITLYAKWEITPYYD
jgi:uncharacterized repeat protein (TIGR02543 family)